MAPVVRVRGPPRGFPILGEIRAWSSPDELVAELVRPFANPQPPLCTLMAMSRTSRRARAKRESAFTIPPVNYDRQLHMARLTIAPSSTPPDLPSLDELLARHEGAYIGIHVGASHWASIGGFEPDDYVHEVAGDVAVIGSGGELLGKLGEFVVKLVDVDSAIADSESVFDVFDQSATTIGYFDLYEAHGLQFRESVLRELGCEGESVPCGLLILDRLELAPKFRGRGVGLTVMACLIGRFRMGAGMVAIKPFPLQFEGDVSDEPEKLRLRGLDQYPASQPACVRRLVRHYRKLGFERVPRTPYMCLPLIWGFRPPHAE